MTRLLSLYLIALLLGPLLAADITSTDATADLSLTMTTTSRTSLTTLRTCGENEEYRSCGPLCRPTCSDVRKRRHRFCSLRCFSGCFCKDGYVLKGGLQKDCVKKETC
ncbi:unnamed protein product [Soboliphyme baturini]|uniref:TIL domain-containing protein n=1 Tax=Soboliphyme baturini TaxID=241478 RepID=A0A183IZL4_9BILA|nr:unnamed protein product [Soboliphyme baturini]